MVFKWILLLIHFTLVTSNVWYISPSGNNANSGSSPSAPFADLVTALAQARSGDTIYCAAGSYSGTSNTGLEIAIANLTIIGQSGSSSTIFLGQNTLSTVFSLADPISFQVSKLSVKFQAKKLI